MTKIQCTYKGGGLAVLRHGPTGSEITTDLPPDNGGKGRGFSATDLLASSLASCILTIMGKASEKRGESLAGATIEIEKTMAENPRRVAKFAIVLSLPPGLSENTRKICLACVDACPVHRSLHPSIAVDLRVL